MQGDHGEEKAVGRLVGIELVAIEQSMVFGGVCCHHVEITHEMQVLLKSWVCRVDT